MQSKIGPLLLLMASSAIANVQSSQGPYSSYPTARPAAPSGAIAADIERWTALRQTDALPFSTYASFLLSHRGWPGEASLRRTAEQRLSLESAYPGDVQRFFAAFPPDTPGGHAALAFALQASGRSEAAREEARRAWTGGTLPPQVEQRLLATFGSAFTPDDHDRRMEALGVSPLPSRASIRRS